jgi:hypothetical protein
MYCLLSASHPEPFFRTRESSLATDVPAIPIDPSAWIITFIFLFSFCFTFPSSFHINRVNLSIA